MEIRVLWKKKTELVSYFGLALMAVLFPLGSLLNDEGNALMSIKASFSNIANMLLDWNDAHDDNFYSWHGVFCDNVSLSVPSLNLSNLNLGGEILPAIRDLGNLEYIDL
ncbi:hypothetical protein TB2_023836 [Malus domestica]